MLVKRIGMNNWEEEMAAMKTMLENHVKDSEEKEMHMKL